MAAMSISTWEWLLVALIAVPFAIMWIMAMWGAYRVLRPIIYPPREQLQDRRPQWQTSGGNKTRQ
jgi:uncharacterized membrane protein